MEQRPDPQPTRPWRPQRPQRPPQPPRSSRAAGVLRILLTVALGVAVAGLSFYLLRELGY